MDETARILLVDDEPNALKVLSSILAREGYRVFVSGGVDGALGIIGCEDIDAVISDLRMPGKDGTQLFEALSFSHPDVPVIFLTAYGTVDTAVHAIKNGAYHYFTKPPDYDRLKQYVADAVRKKRLRSEVEKLRNSCADDSARLLDCVQRSRGTLETIRAIRDSESSVLICGETGSGKEVAARALHFSGKRRDMPFVAVNCAAIPRELLESELFGFEKGAFTGAMARKPGKFEEAAGGTLFLDEIGEMDLALQAKLLRVIEEKKVERLGSNGEVAVDFRLVCSTNRDLEECVRKGRFRKALYYRINVIKIMTPPLRERAEDIPLLAAEFLHQFCLRENKAVTVSDKAMGILRDYHWPGNIRQLRNVMERAVVLARGNVITPGELPGELRSHLRTSRNLSSSSTLRQMEMRAVRDALRWSEGNKSRAAKMLGISRKAFYKRLNEIEPASNSPSA